MHRLRMIIVAVVATFALAGLASYTVQLVFFLKGSRENADIARLVAGGINQVVNVIIIFLAWAIFEGLGRIEREADRIQSFMDNVYRRLP